MSQALYDRIGIGYSPYRRPDERFAARIDAALGASRIVLNLGAGTGSYEPAGRSVVAVEPSAEMIRQRPHTAAPSLQASAERLPFADATFDAVLAVLTIHHWPRREDGLAEMRRVARDRVVIVTWDPEHAGFWLVQDYLPEIVEMDRPIFPSLADLEKSLGPIEVQALPVPADCSDGFLGAYWRRPREYLDERVRGAISTFSKLEHAETGLARLRSDIEDGTWDDRYSALHGLTELDVGYRLVIARYDAI
jgi:SAM-dependent methyltransferase